MGAIDLLIGPIAGLLEKVIPDINERARLAAEIATLAERNAHAEAIAQAEINKVEAAHKSLFVAGWRPGAGWVCVAALAHNYLILPYVLAIGVDVPQLEIGELMPVLLGMLGLGTLRSYEKANGVAREK